MRVAGTDLIDAYRHLLTVLDRIEDGPEKRVFENYCGSLRSPSEAARYVRFVQSLVDLAGVDLPRTRVLEAGCGFGFLCVSLALLGARAVHGLEVAAHRIEDIRRFRPLLPPGLPLHFCRGDVARLPYRDGSIDLLLVVEAISHFVDVEVFLQEAHRVLAPGGRLLVSDGNNGANPLVRRRTAAYWARLERGAGGAQQDAHGQLRKPFVEARAEILERDAGLPAAAARELAERTSGLRRAEVVAAGRRFAATGERPDREYRYGTCPMDPVNDQYEEMLFHPCELGARLDRLGFRSRVLPHFGGEARGGWILGMNRGLQRLPARWTAPAARGFRIVAEKRRSR